RDHRRRPGRAGQDDVREEELSLDARRLHPQTYVIGVRLEIVLLLEHRLARHVQDASGDHAARLAARMRVHRRDHAGKSQSEFLPRPGRIGKGDSPDTLTLLEPMDYQDSVLRALSFRGDSMATLAAAVRPFVNEPLLDFRKEANSQAMRAAIEKARKELGREYDMVIGGRRLRTEEKIKSVNPARPSEVIGIHQKAGREH